MKSAEAPAGRITVSLIAKAARDLDLLRERTGLSKTDLVNRAITLYEFVEAQVADGGQMLVRDAGGASSVLKLL